MKRIIKAGEKIYDKVLKHGEFKCADCGCIFEADEDDIEHAEMIADGIVVNVVITSICPCCGGAADLKKGEFDMVERRYDNSEK